MEDLIFKIIFGIINLLVLGLVGLFFYNFKQLVKRVEKCEGEMKEIKSNYLARFDELKNILTSIQISIARNEQKLDDLIVEHKRITSSPSGCKGY